MSSELPDRPDDASRPSASEEVVVTGLAELDSIDPDILSRLHATSLIFDVIAHARAYIIPAIIALFSAASGEIFGILIAGFIFIPALLASIFRYFTFRYSIQDRELVITRGLLFRSVRTVPVSRIQNVDYVQNLLHRALNVAEVRVETASGTEPEATMRVLSIDQMEKLRSEIFDLQSESDGATNAAQDTAQSVESATAAITRPINRAEGKTLLEIPVAWLTRAGLASNRGMIIVGIVVGALFQFEDSRRFDRMFRELERFIPDDLGDSHVVLGIVVGVILVLVLLRLFGIAWFILRFYDYRLVRHGEDLRISCGLLTRVSATVPRNRIQFISIHRNLFMRWMNLASIRIETAGGAGNDNEDATATVSRRWFVPVIANEQIPALLSELRPGLNWDESKIEFHPLAKRAGRRLVRFALVAAIVISLVGLGITRPWGGVAGLALLPVFIWWALKKSRSMKYARTGDGVVFRSGVLNRKISMTFFEKIQTLMLEQTPFDRRWKMARLVVDTAASGPAEHQVSVPLLDVEFAESELQLLREKSARHEPSFA